MHNMAGSPKRLLILGISAQGDITLCNDINQNTCYECDVFPFSRKRNDCQCCVFNCNSIPYFAR